ncbi:uncharacterized protein LOC114522489 isoform X2 [Dendronephthya gigantea]|uniref:uncharacterized protein LOC114522489 isoform X2 n=1 Tax=Dendronephthya gigantea TaxID=151771 RepID=UPI00106B72B5|nr:uncharacterized protein LOC114522489 isoform X2 [Dendronephthya gigantea]
MAHALETDPINKLEETLQCTVCLEPLKDPRTLPCFHSFCKDCLEDVVKTCRDKAPRGRPVREFPCPYCREMFTLDPDKNVADMRKNHFICNMVNATAVLNRDRKFGVPCSHNCSQSYSVARCVTCEKFLCRECLTDHNKYRGHTGHSVLTMEELSKPENRKKINDKMYCNEHQGKKLKVYCETCDQLICKDCMDFKHVKENHSCFLVKDVANKYKELLTSNNKIMNEVLAKNIYSLQKLLRTTEGLERDAEYAKTKITQRKEFILKNVVEMLDQKTKTLFNKVENVRANTRTKLDKQTKETKEYVENLQRSVHLSNKLLEQGTDEEILSSQKIILENANNLRKRLADLNKTIPVSEFNYTPRDNKEPLHKGFMRELETCLGEVNEKNPQTEHPAITKIPADFEFEKKILVTGIPEGVTENQVYIHFQKKKNGGGEIERFTLISGRKAIIAFADPEVATAVANKKHIIYGNALEVKLLPADTKSRMETSQLRNISTEKEARTILVSGLPGDVTESSVHIHFQKKKNRGGEIEEITLLPGGKAFVVFEDPEVAKMVVEREQIFKGNLLKVNLVEKETFEDNVEKLTTDESSRGKEARTITVFGLPEDATEKGLHIHFQRKKNGGGEIEEVTLLPGGKAMVVFEDPEAATTVVNTEQIFKGNVFKVKGKGKSTLNKAAEKLPEYETSGGKEARTITVFGLPEDATEKRSFHSFSKKEKWSGKNGC